MRDFKIQDIDVLINNIKKSTALKIHRKKIQVKGRENFVMSGFSRFY
jgi:GTP cyclohydrolase II